ncbi:MAG: LamG domain-containing protein, partial [Planctomycetota bacterium]
VPGVIRQAINLDGFDDYVLADDGGASMNGLDALTIALWVKSDVVGTDRGFIHFEDPCGHDNRGMRYDAMGVSGGGTNLIKVGVTSDAAGGPVGWPGRQQLESSSNVQTNDWQHLAMTWSSGKQLKLYINGLLDTPTYNEPALTGVLTGYKKVIIGRGGKYAPPAGGWDGLIDDVRIYDRALSKEQINTQMIGLMAHYKLDESSGLIAADSSCHGNHGKLSDGPTWQPAGGLFGGALLFDGIDDRVDCGGVGISGNAARTIGAWAKASTLAIPAWTTVFGFSNAGSINDTYFDIESDNLGNYVLHTNGWETILWPVDLNWHHFAATHDGIFTTWYRDGSLVGSAPKTLSTVDEVRMGLRKMNYNYFPGLIDDVAIFNSALSSSDIFQLIYFGGASFIGDPNLVALWELNESSGYTAGDISGNGNHGTLNDPPVWRPLGGQIKGALDFDGKDDFVDNGKTASQLGIGGNNPRTITAWVFTHSFKGGGIFEIGEDGSGADGRDFSLRAKWIDNNWRIQYWGATYDVDFIYTSKNKWVHFAHVHDGSYTRVYADGQEVVKVPRTLNTTDNKTLRLGRWQNNYFDGLIDDVRVYNRALPEEEIKSLSGTGDDIFWLSVAAVYQDDVTFIDYPWGWKTRPESWMDDAVRFELFEEPTVGMITDPYMITPIEDPRTQESFDVAFELDTDPNYIKWEQPFTGIRHWPHYEDELSKAVVDPDQGTVWIDRMVADDWRCDLETPVTAAVWWGSYIGYEYYACQEEQLPDPVKPDYFLLTIWTDVPAGADPDPDVPFSHPGKKKWEYTAYDYDEVLVGYDKYPHGIRNEPVFRYSVRLPEHAWFLQEDVNNIYWFSVVAVYKAGTDPQYDWGWTNHPHAFNDDAVAGYFDPIVDEWTWEELYDQTERSEDMSFILFTRPECTFYGHPDYLEWLSVGKPDCWCCPRQCHGNATPTCEPPGGSAKTGFYYVGPLDLNTLVAAWLVLEPGFGPGIASVPNGICADFAHDLGGSAKTGF